MKKFITILFMTLFFASNTFAEVGGTITRGMPAVPPPPGAFNSPVPVVTTTAVTTSIKNEVKKIYKGSVPKTYLNKEDFLKGEGKTCSSATDGCNRVMMKDGVLGAMTMMYCEDIYGKNGKEQWSCLDNELNVSYDDLEYVNQDKINKFIPLTNKLNELLKKFNVGQLEKGVENASKQIESVKLSRIAREMQIEKITVLYFLKDLFQTEIAKR